MLQVNRHPRLLCFCCLRCRGNLASGPPQADTPAWTDGQRPARRARRRRSRASAVAPVQTGGIRQKAGYAPASFPRECKAASSGNPAPTGPGALPCRCRYRVRSGCRANGHEHRMTDAAAQPQAGAWPLRIARSGELHRRAAYRASRRETPAVHAAKSTGRNSACTNIVKPRKTGSGQSVQRRPTTAPVLSSGRYVSKTGPCGHTAAGTLHAGSHAWRDGTGLRMRPARRWRTSCEKNPGMARLSFANLQFLECSGDIGQAPARSAIALVEPHSPYRRESP